MFAHDSFPRRMTDIHGERAVDPLKLTKRLEDKRRGSSYHGERAVDPLKLRPTTMSQTVTVSIHGERAVDPLKLQRPWRGREVGSAIPRRASRGPH